MRPYFQISVGGQDLTGKLAGRGISLTVTDGVGLSSDSVQIEIDDQDGVVSAPRTGVKITVSGGYVDGAYRTFGEYIVDQVQFSGYPQKISISAQAADAKSAQKSRRPKDYRKEKFPTYGDIYKDLAGRMGLQLAIDGSIAGTSNPYEGQGEEDDMAFGSRMGGKLDAHVSIKSGRLIVVPRGAGTTASGGAMPQIVVARGVNVLSYNATLKDKPKHTKVKATWFDRKKVERKEVEEKAGSEGPDYLIRKPYNSEAEAKAGAKARAGELKRGEASATFTINGDPNARAEAYVSAQGLRSNVDGLWRATTVTHNFSATGAYTTSIQCELPK